MKTLPLFVDVISFDERDDTLHINVPMCEEDESVPLLSMNDDLDCDDTQEFSLHLFQALTGCYDEGADMVGKRFEMVGKR